MRARREPQSVTAMQLITLKIDKPDATNFILGQTHFIKSVEDIGQVPGASVGH